MNEQQEYERIKALFDGIDEQQAALIDGLIREAARAKIQLDILHGETEKTGLVRIHPTIPWRQEELPISKALVKIRASYKDCIIALSRILGRNVGDEDDDLKEFE